MDKKYDCLRQAIADFEVKVTQWHNRKISKQEVMLRAIHPPWMSGDLTKQAVFRTFLDSITEDDLCRMIDDAVVVQSKMAKGSVDVGEFAMRVVMAFSHPQVMKGERSMESRKKCINWLFDFQRAGHNLGGANLATEMRWKNGIMVAACETVASVYMFERQDAMDLLKTYAELEE